MPAPDLETDLATERRHLAASRTALARMRASAEALFATGEHVAGDPYAAETLGRTLHRRVAELADDPTTPLFFGRLDFGHQNGDNRPRDNHPGTNQPGGNQPSGTQPGGTQPSGTQPGGNQPSGDGWDGTGAEHAGHRYHIGRRHVVDDAGEPMVLDWRAPVSRAFYRASASDPQGVATRRRFGFAGGTLTSFEDEHLDRGEELGTASRILTEEIERPRVGPMRDIVATIQPEQDELVRAELESSICVQGAPGTGKTAVGLHRAAYLLYLHRERLRRSGVLVVGPNRAFLSYIAAVLPALGEVEVQQSTVDDLIARGPLRGSDPPATATLKHDARMATVLRRALLGRISRPPGPITVSDGSYRWRIGEEPLRRVIDDVRREAPPYGIGRERVRARVVALLQRQVEARAGESPSEAWLRRMARCRPVTELLDTTWPAVSPEALVYELLADPAVLAAAADGVLTGAEQALLGWNKPPRSVRTARWSPADAVLLDEAAGLIDRVPSYGHVVIDEAQDLSAMQCRTVARRSEHGSVTLLGDLAQGTAPWAASDWRETLAHLGKPGAPVVPLTIGFRVPAVVLALANRLLPALGVDVPPAVSLRRDGTLDIQQVTDLPGAAVVEVRKALGYEGSIALIAADADADRLGALLRAAGVAAGTVADPEATERVTVVPASLVKGLEYDHVIVMEPAAIVAAEPRGLHRLYVVLTRAVSRLSVLHCEPLPAPLS